MPEKSTVSHKKNKKFLIWRLYFCIFKISFQKAAFLVEFAIFLRYNNKTFAWRRCCHAEYRARRAGDPAKLRQYRAHLRGDGGASASHQAPRVRHFRPRRQARGAGLLVPSGYQRVRKFSRPFCKASRGGTRLLARHDEGPAGLLPGGIQGRLLALFRKGDRGPAGAFPRGAL